MKIKDMLGLGKVLPIDKLIEVVSSVTGRLSKSYFDRKDIDTKAYEIRKLAEARADEMRIISTAVKENFKSTGRIQYKENALIISSPKEGFNQADTLQFLNNQSLSERVKDRVDFQESKKQLNIESITAYAAEQLKDEPTVTDEPVDEDWKTRFFSIAEDISNDEMQALWGRILAGEVKRPKSFSLRTLELLKNLNKAEAECFLKFAKLAITSSGASFLLNFNNEKLLEEKYKLNFGERLLLEELGLLAANNLQFEIKANPDGDSQTIFRIGSTCVIADRRQGSPQQDLKVLVFTKIGQELLQLIESTPELDYIQLLASKVRREGVTLQYAQILELGIGEMEIDDLFDVPLP